MFRLVFERQWLHVLLGGGLIVGVIAAQHIDGVGLGALWGVDTLVWTWLAVATAVVHQVYVWFCWRAQLHASLLTKWFSSRAFALYAVGFAVLGISRVVFVFLLAVSNRDTLDANRLVLRLLAIVMAAPAAYLFYSVARYFHFRRALGIDHFDPRYRSEPLVRRGIFRYTSNGMYVFGFLLLWIPAFWWASAAALVVAGFNHLYIWVHYVCTERPDMRRIYP